MYELGLTWGEFKLYIISATQDNVLRVGVLMLQFVGGMLILPAHRCDLAFPPPRYHYLSDSPPGYRLQHQYQRHPAGEYLVLRAI
jgi:hypothetical protein